MQCCVDFCKSTQENVPKSGEEGKSISFHRFPSEANLRAAWLRGLDKQDSTLPDSAVVCSQHFLTDDIYETECGSRQIHTGAIPSTVQVCMICLDTDSKLFLMSRHKLEEAYVQLTGHPPYDQGTLRQTLCVQCAQRLMNFSRFRDRSLRARALMMDLVEQHNLITKQHIQTIDRATHQLNNNMVFTTLGPDHCDLHIQEDKQTDTETTIHSVVVKTEGGYDSTEVDEDMEVMKCEEFNIEIVMDPLKYESAPHQCTLCFEEFVDEHEYTEHMRLHPQNDAGAGDHCPSQVRPHTAVNYRSHSARSSDNKAKQNQEPHTFADPPHTLVAPSSAGLKTNNKNKTHATEEVNTVQKCELEIICNRHKVPEKKSFMCDICRKMFKNKNVLVKHTKTLHFPKPESFACKFCENKFKHKNYLAVHMRTHTGDKPFSCELCEYRCAQKSSLVSHTRTHTGEKPFTCNLCDHKCTKKSNLLSHMRTHTGEKPYSCKLCEYKCSLKLSLVNHMRKHTGEKPYSCKLCEYKCSVNSSLVNHMRTHTGEKPYSCNLCEFKCSLSSNLLQHLRTHTGEKPYSCELCEFQCSLNGNLLKHMRTHTGERPYSCKLREYRCTAKRNLVTHMRTHTGEKP